MNCFICTSIIISIFLATVCLIGKMAFLHLPEHPQCAQQQKLPNPSFVQLPGSGIQYCPGCPTRIYLKKIVVILQNFVSFISDRASYGFVLAFSATRLPGRGSPFSSTCTCLFYDNERMPIDQKDTRREYRSLFHLETTNIWRKCISL